MFCWVYAIFWSIWPFLGWGRYIPEGILDSCSFDYLTRDDRVKEHINKICELNYIMFKYKNAVNKMVII